MSFWVSMLLNSLSVSRSKKFSSTEPVEPRFGLALLSTGSWLPYCDSRDIGVEKCYLGGCGEGVLIGELGTGCCLVFLSCDWSSRTCC